ncbi:GNAT family N-acetyltransferase [Micromonospora musae]|nr:GNAT family N-acetyltransferase [Micromonospora musae]
MSAALAVRARRAVPAEFDALLPAYLAVFADEAVLSWVIPDPVERAASAVPLVREVLHAAVGANQVIVAELADGSLGGMSLWLPPVDDVTRRRPAPPPAPAGHVDGLIAHRFAAVSELVAAHRPAEPHLYLASIGVRADLRGRGVGGVLLAEGLRVADAENLPTYLEASTERSRRLYLRHGFRDHGRPLPLPDGGPVLWPMRRPSSSGRT